MIVNITIIIRRRRRTSHRPASRVGRLACFTPGLARLPGPRSGSQGWPVDLSYRLISPTSQRTRMTGRSIDTWKNYNGRSICWSFGSHKLANGDQESPCKPVLGSTRLEETTRPPPGLRPREIPEREQRMVGYPLGESPSARTACLRPNLH